MAIEIDGYEYKFMSRPLIPADVFLELDAPSFYYNSLHDLESIWWVGVRTIFTCGVDGAENHEAL
jgi:hypothetical protein